MAVSAASGTGPTRPHDGPDDRPRDRPLAGRIAVVTGASAGIGRATAAALAAAGAEVWAVARRADRLDALAAETGCRAVALDVAEPGAFEALAGRVTPDILVNNAGIGAGIAGLAGASAEDIDRTIGLNVSALLRAVRAFLPALTARRGDIVNIGSVSGLYPTRSAIYGASKAAVRMASRNLRLELVGTGVRVIELCPGRVATEFYDAAIPDDPDARDRLKTTGIAELTAEDVAEAVLWAVTRARHVNVSTLELQPVEQVFGGVRFDPLDFG
jgi:NADP-dependent 3-hydroxy acid dehydrogenase YdfG